MHKNWLIVYRGVLADRKLTRKGAEATAFELSKAKGWDFSLVEVKEDSGVIPSWA